MTIASVWLPRKHSVEFPVSDLRGFIVTGAYAERRVVINRKRLHRLVLGILLTVAPLAVAQQAISIQGKVLDPAGKAVPAATVKLEKNGGPGAIETITNVTGVFSFQATSGNSYRLTAEKSGLHSTSATIPALQKDPPPIDLTLSPNSGPDQTMEFADAPNFTVAGVTDWTAVGGHGSDSTLRTSEDLARETRALKARNARSVPTDPTEQQAERHRIAGEKDEEKGDPLAAVHEEEEAVRLDPSEQNYFAWGSELLLHRAIWQAASVFRNGAKAHPESARMLTALGTALFAGDLFEEAAANFCAASDLNPKDQEPYTFMGRVDIVSPKPLPCVASRLERFRNQAPQSSTANYLYAMALKKRLHPPADLKAERQVEALLSRAVALDPQCAPADLQLGILAAAQHKTEQAVAYYTQAIKADPRLGEAHYRLGVAYDRLGAADKAKHEFQLHDEIEALQAAKVEQQRKEVKQFRVRNGEPATHER